MLLLLSLELLLLFKQTVPENENENILDWFLQNKLEAYGDKLCSFPIPYKDELIIIEELSINCSSVTELL